MSQQSRVKKSKMESVIQSQPTRTVQRTLIPPHNQTAPNQFIQTSNQLIKTFWQLDQSITDDEIDSILIMFENAPVIYDRLDQYHFLVTGKKDALISLRDTLYFKNKILIGGLGQEQSRNPLRINK